MGWKVSFLFVARIEGRVRVCRTYYSFIGFASLFRTEISLFKADVSPFRTRGCRTLRWTYFSDQNSERACAGGLLLQPLVFVSGLSLCQFMHMSEIFLSAKARLALVVLLLGIHLLLEYRVKVFTISVAPFSFFFKVYIEYAFPYITWSFLIGLLGIPVSPCTLRLMGFAFFYHATMCWLVFYIFPFYKVMLLQGTALSCSMVHYYLPIPCMYVRRTGSRLSLNM